MMIVLFNTNIQKNINTGLPPAPADAAAAQHLAQGQHAALAGVREHDLDALHCDLDHCSPRDSWR